MYQTAPILVAEDDAANRALCQSILTNAGYAVANVWSCLQVKQHLSNSDYSVVLLDVGLPDGNGLSLLDSVPEGTAVIVMTVRDGPEQRAEALRMGALDYLVKPFHPDELLWRIRRVLETMGAGAKSNVDTVWQGYRLEEQRRELWAPTGEKLRLTEGEFGLLDVLLTQGSAVSTDMLTDAISAGVGNHRSVAVLISRLRRKFRDTEGFKGLEIRPVHGFGYALDHTAGA